MSGSGAYVLGGWLKAGRGQGIDGVRRGLTEHRTALISWWIVLQPSQHPLGIVRNPANTP